MGGIAWGLHGMLLGIDQTWEQLATKTSGIADFGGIRPDYLLGWSLFEVFALLGFVSYAAIYSALAYMTFGCQWPDKDMTDNGVF